MRLSVFLLSLLIPFMSFADEVDIESGSGLIKLEYEPKSCLITPCPQFKVMSINGQGMAALGADLINLDPNKSALSSFRKIIVKGKWQQKAENYIEIQVIEWNAIIKEELAPKEKK
jgi:hypothetical protein